MRTFPTKINWFSFKRDFPKRGEHVIIVTKDNKSLLHGMYFDRYQGKYNDSKPACVVCAIGGMELRLYKKDILAWASEEEILKTIKETDLKYLLS